MRYNPEGFKLQLNGKEMWSVSKIERFLRVVFTPWLIFGTLAIGSQIEVKMEYDSMMLSSSGADVRPRETATSTATIDLLDGSFFWIGNPILRWRKDGSVRVYRAELFFEDGHYSMLLQNLDPSYLDSPGGVGGKEILSEMVLSGDSAVDWFSGREIMILGKILFPGNIPVSRYGSFDDLLVAEEKSLPNLLKRSLVDADFGTIVRFENSVETVDVAFKGDPAQLLPLSIKATYTHPHGYYTSQAEYRFDDYHTFGVNGVAGDIRVPLQLSYVESFSKEEEYFEERLVVKNVRAGESGQSSVQASKRFMSAFPDVFDRLIRMGVASAER